MVLSSVEIKVVKSHHFIQYIHHIWLFLLEVLHEDLDAGGLEDELGEIIKDPSERSRRIFLLCDDVADDDKAGSSANIDESLESDETKTFLTIDRHMGVNSFKISKPVEEKSHD